MEQKPRNPETDRLIYQNINLYRLHADNLRFSLFTGYIAAIAASIYYFSNQRFSLAYCGLVYAVSLLFMMVIAIQNWFYVLFARFMRDCEQKLADGEPLSTLNEFAESNGSSIKPSHPTFDMIMYIFSILEGYLLYLLVLNGFNWSSALWGNDLFKVLLFLLATGASLALIIICYRKWDKLIYRRVIKKTSSLFTGD